MNSVRNCLIAVLNWLPILETFVARAVKAELVLEAVNFIFSSVGALTHPFSLRQAIQFSNLAK